MPPDPAHVPFAEDAAQLVASWATTAGASYRAAGLVRMDARTETEWNRGQPAGYKWMRA